MKQEEGVCPCCQQTLPPEYDFYLPPGYRILFNMILKAGKQGIRSDRLYQKIYGNRHDGGPQQKTLNVRVYHLNKVHLKQHKLRVVGERTCSPEYGTYKVRNVV